MKQCASHEELIKQISRLEVSINSSLKDEIKALTLHFDQKHTETRETITKNRIDIAVLKTKQTAIAAIAGLGGGGIAGLVKIFFLKDKNMEKIKVELELPKEANELFEGMYNIVKIIKDALDDGWQPGQDLPTIVTQSIMELPKMISGIDQLPKEFTDDPADFFKAGMISVGKIVSLFINQKKQE